jgi:copper oxidase (laccase) domain-containing protein
MFEKKYQELRDILVQMGNRYFLNLPSFAELQLKKMGIPLKHIETSAVCTKESVEFFSYRALKNKNETKVFVGIIGMI